MELGQPLSPFHLLPAKACKKLGLVKAGNKFYTIKVQQ
jgi:hypothetical protein